MIKRRLTLARKELNLTQAIMAERLCMTQSQYQRREQGEIRITDDEWVKLAKVLGKGVDEIYEDDAVNNISNYGNYSANSLQSTNHFYNIPDFIMQNQQEYIEMLKKENATLSAELAKVKSKQ